MMVILQKKFHRLAKSESIPVKERQRIYSLPAFSLNLYPTPQTV